MTQPVVIFDLDDTLIDTHGVLLPEALERVAAAAGLPLAALDPAGKSIDEVLAGADLAPDARARAAAAWYDPAVPELEPLPGAREVLAGLRPAARLFLLTRGNPERQRNKVAACGLGPYFEDVLVRPIEGTGSKRDDIVAILERCGVSPAGCVVIGDDPDDELAHARALGCLAIEVPATALSSIPRHPAVRRPHVLILATAG